MMIKNTILSILLGVSLMFLSSCENDDPSVLKVYVRSSDNILTENAKVMIIGDVDQDTPEYKDEKRTNESGVAEFDLTDLFDQYGKKDDKVAYFTVYAKDTAEFYTKGKARAKQYLISSETINLEE